MPEVFSCVLKCTKNQFYVSWLSKCESQNSVKRDYILSTSNYSFQYLERIMSKYGLNVDLPRKQNSIPFRYYPFKSMKSMIVYQAYYHDATYISKLVSFVSCLSLISDQFFQT